MRIKISKIILSLLIIIFSVISGLYFGTIKVKNYRSNQDIINNQDKESYIFPSSAIINLENGDTISGKKEIIISAPGSVALRLSAYTLEGDEVSQAEIPKNGSITKFIWDTAKYTDGQYYLNLMVYYKNGAPSNITKFLTINNESFSMPRKKIAYEKLLIEKIKISEDGNAVISGFVLAKDRDENVYLNSLLDKRSIQIYPNQSGLWEVSMGIAEGRHVFELESGENRSYKAEFYYSSSKPVINDPINKEDIKKEITKYGFFGGGIGVLFVSFAWLLGIILLGKEKRSYED